MTDLELIEKILNKSKIPFSRNYSSEIMISTSRLVWWLTVIEPSGNLIDFKFDKDGNLESIASEMTE